MRLAWCRVHNGEFQQPRRSDWGIAYPPGGAVPDLQFLGRGAGSLNFKVTNPGTSGFRYDMVPDLASKKDTPVLPPATPPPLPGGLPAYLCCYYYEPGAPLFPWSLTRYHHNGTLAPFSQSKLPSTALCRQRNAVVQQD